jgi:hypothetical protein
MMVQDIDGAMKLLVVLAVLSGAAVMGIWLLVVVLR